MADTLEIRPFLRHIPQYASAVAIAVIIVYALWLLEGRAGLSLWDEGYLWYGSQRVLQGDVPIRDFQAYDPARYYWSAAFMSLLHDDGAIAVRIAGYTFQAIGLAFLLSTPATERRHDWLLQAVCIGLVLALWMFPRHKLYDVTIAATLVAGAARWLQVPSNRATILLGVLVGASAIVGRNHGVYALIGCCVLLTMTPIDERRFAGPRYLLFFAGVIIGYLPMLVMLVTIPDLAGPFFQSIAVMFERGATNIPLPVPWPWTFSESADMPEKARHILTGLAFVALLSIPVTLLYLWAKSRASLGATAPLSMAGAAMALPYAHFAFARADISHLAQGAVPALIALLTFPYKTRSTRVLCFALVLVCSLAITVPVRPGWLAWRNAWGHYRIAGEHLRLPAHSADELDAVMQVADSRLSPRQNLLAVPYWPGAYALLRQESPIREIYPLFPRSNIEQAQELERIRSSRVAVVLLHQGRLDGRPDRTFASTHPLIYKALKLHYSKQSADPRLPEVEILEEP